MAVYTQVDEEALAVFLNGYALGAPLSLKGIAEGSENSNFLLETETGRYILTLYEKRVRPEDLPFFLNLLKHLAGEGLPSAEPQADSAGQLVGTLSGRPAAIVDFLEGLAITHPTTDHASQVGIALAKLHSAGKRYGQSRENTMGLAHWPALVDRLGARADEIAPNLSNTLQTETILSTRELARTSTPGHSARRLVSG